MRKYRFQCWNVAFRRHSADIENNIEPFIVIPNTFRYWAADPFIIHKEDKYFIFAELYDRLKRKGDIGYCVLSEDGQILSKWKKIINSKVHMSFPYLLYKNGKLLMMPESGKEHHLCYYEFVDFPSIPRLYKLLLSGVQVCDTIEIGEDYLWAYDNFGEIWKAVVYKNINGKFTKYKEYADNEKRLRAGGKSFLHKGEMIVPMQNGNGEYGKSLFFTNISLTESGDISTSVIFEFNTSNIVIKNLKEKIIGLHTYNFDSSFEVIDIKTRNITWADFLGLILKKLGI